MTRTEFISLMEKKILVLDGAMGTALIRYGLSVGQAPEEFNLSNPQVVARVHQSFIKAGADIILTNTFGATKIKLAEYHLSDKAGEINRRAVEIAHKSAKSRVLVAGSIGPSGRYLPPIGSLNFKEALTAFKTQAKVLTECGVDLIVVETISDIRELRACLIGIREVFSGPLVAHMTYSDGYNTITGTDPETQAVLMEALDVDVVGINCSTGPKGMVNLVKSLVEATHLPISVEPNAGLPEIRDGRACYPATPQEMASYALKFVEMGANMVGGCCGAGYEHIRAIAEAVKGIKPRKREIKRRGRLCSRDRTVVIDEAIATPIMGERINPSGRKKFADEIIAGDFTQVRAEADKQVKSGAVIIDVNMGIPGQDEPGLLRKAVQVVQSTVNTPISLDSANIQALEAGLEEVEGKPIINSVTAEEEKLQKIIPLAKKYGAALIGLPIDEEGVPETAEKRFKLGEKIFRRALTAGIAREDIYLDGLTLAVSAENRAPEVTLKTIELFRQELGAKTVLGVSNVSFGLPRRAEVNAAFLTMALQRGLSLPIVNPYSRPILDAIRLADLLLGKDLYGKAFLASAEEKEREEALKPMVEEEKPIAEQLFDAVLFGNSEGISGLVRKALKAGLGAMEINDKVLVPAMEEVGRRYDRKKFFLPQVILAAEAMRTAFIALKAHIPAAAEKSKGTILLATVRGDVHDIGKNLVAALVENHGYRVVDLGKNVSAIEIINRAEAEKADVIGLSALLTTTMLVMKETVAELRAAVGAKIIVGGAVVTRKFAQEIGADGYGKDASEAVKEIDRLCIPTLEQGNQKSR